MVILASKKVATYVVIDDQSNSSLAKSQLLDALNVDGEETTYTLRTCSGTTQLRGRCVKGLIVETLDGKISHELSSVIECNSIPDSKDEIPTPSMARARQHLQEIALKIPKIRKDVDILMLIGRDAPPLLKIHESRNGPRNAPWGQRLDLGWVILGNACLGGTHKPKPSCYKTHLLDSGRPSILQPCNNRFHVCKSPSYNPDDNANGQRKETFDDGSFDDGLGVDVFANTKEDDKPSQSIEDRKFIHIMNEQMAKNDAGNWEAPLPFRHKATQLPDNKEQARKRLQSTRRTLERKPTMKKHYFEFMQKIFDNGHAEPVPSAGDY